MNADRWTKNAVVAAAAIGLVGVGAGIGVAATSAVVDTSSVRLRVLQSQFADGFDSGWHTHPGLVVVQVQAGHFKIYQGSCQPVVVQPGESFLEVPFVPVRAVATGEIRWTTSQILPMATAPTTSVTSPCG